MPSVQSRVLAYVAPSTLRELELAIKDTFLKILFRGSIGTSLLDYEFSLIDVVTHLDYGITSYTLDKLVADALWLVLRKIAQVVHCAAWQHNPYESRKPLPSFIPTYQLSALGVTAPLISLVLANPVANPLLEAFSSVKALRERVQLVKQAAFRFIGWIGNAITLSIEIGAGATWNWGAYWGLTWEEFLGRIEGVKKEGDQLAGTETCAIDDNPLAVILHPTHSSTAIRAAQIFDGDIPIQAATIYVELEDNSVFENEFISLFV
ncbi:hypothetical protein DXG01_002589 [Tephrocybe rancida]|nr:hypothetical protein DXG01_002589 [Tephrocybe rancida]